MASQGGIVEQKTIGLQIGLSGVHNKTEVINGEVQLKPIPTSFGGTAYAEEGSWTSDVVDIGDNFNSYGKLFTTHTDNSGSTISVLTRTSDDGIVFDGWNPIAVDGTIQSVKKRFIQVRVNFYAGFGDTAYSVVDKYTAKYADTTNGLKLKREYVEDMQKDDSWSDSGSLHKSTVNPDEW